MSVVIIQKENIWCDIKMTCKKCLVLRRLSLFDLRLTKTKAVFTLECDRCGTSMKLTMREDKS